AEELTRLIVTEAARVYRKTCRDGSVVKIRFGETQHVLGLTRSSLQGDSQTFAKPEKIVGLIVQSKEAPANTADTATESDRVPAFLFKLEVDVEVGIGWVRLNFSIFVFYLLKVTELIQPQKTEVP